jgi:hypothetical protein
MMTYHINIHVKPGIFLVEDKGEVNQKKRWGRGMAIYLTIVSMRKKVGEGGLALKMFQVPPSCMFFKMEQP